MRGATWRGNAAASGVRFQSTRPMRGATIICDDHLVIGDISIHAPHAGRDFPSSVPWYKRYQFQSTRPMRGATVIGGLVVHAVDISIHAPHAGRDVSRLILCPVIQSISIHAPHAGRDPITSSGVWGTTYFNPRAPCGARQQRCFSKPVNSDFNPRAPCGARLRKSQMAKTPVNFNPRAPCGARLSGACHC